MEALAPRSLDKRLPSEWLTRCYHPAPPVVSSKSPAVPGLVIYQAPQPGRRYVVGADPAEGNPTSASSALTVLDMEGGAEVAALAGRFEPATFAHYIDLVGVYFNSAHVLVERNNHGHAVLLWLREHSRLMLLPGHDHKPGWLTTTAGKSLLYDHAGQALREGNAVIRNPETYSQLASIEGTTLRAPSGLADDRAMSYILALSVCARGAKAYPRPPSEDSWPCLLTAGYRMGAVPPDDELPAGYEKYRGYQPPPIDDQYWG